MSPADIARALRRVSRLLHKGMRRGGRHGTKKGRKGYSRRPKHPKHKGKGET